jgi:hypothetical protein
MTQTAINRRLAQLRTATEKYTPRVEKKLASSGGRTHTAMAKSAAKYYVALKKLADE